MHRRWAREINNKNTFMHQVNFNGRAGTPPISSEIFEAETTQHARERQLTIFSSFSLIRRSTPSTLDRYSSSSGAATGLGAMMCSEDKRASDTAGDKASDLPEVSRRVEPFSPLLELEEI